MLPEHPELKRVLGLWDSVSVILGIIVGSGIFFTPTSIARELGHEGLILLVWALGGVAALCGALTYAELSSTWPQTGGMYVYIRELFNPLLSFLFGWGQLLIIRPAGSAAVAVVFAQYVAYFSPVSQAGIKLLAVMAIAAVSIINYLGVRLTSVVQNVFTSIKILALIGIVAAGFFVHSNIQIFPDLPAKLDAGISLWGAVGLALVGVFWTYDGWVEITAVAGEVKDPSRTIPRALWMGTLLITILYVLVNAAYLNIIGLGAVRASDHVAADAMVKMIGSFGGSLTAIVVIISTFGSLIGATLTGPRIFFAMAVDGLFFSWAKKIHPVYKTPATAIALQGILSIALVVTWTFDQLATYFVFVSLIFYCLTTVGLFRSRRSPIGRAAPYKTWGYPITPILFLIISAAILLNTCIYFPAQAAVGGGILLAGIPVYFAWRKRWMGLVR